MSKKKPPNLHVSIPDGQKEQLRLRAAYARIPMGTLVSEALWEHFGLARTDDEGSNDLAGADRRERSLRRAVASASEGDLS